MRPLEIARVATVVAAMLTAIQVKAEETAIAASVPADGPWHGLFNCIPLGAFYGGPRSAQFEIGFAGGKGAVVGRFDQVGQFSLQISFETPEAPKLSVDANFGESTWPPLRTTDNATRTSEGVRRSKEWHRSQCTVAMYPGPLPADDTPPKQDVVLAPNDPEVRAPLAPAQPSAPGSRDSEATERTFWETVKDTKDPEEMRAYLTRYPNGAFAELAKIRLARLAGK
jgi:hypothetical protein